MLVELPDPITVKLPTPPISPSTLNLPVLFAIVVDGIEDVLATLELVFVLLLNLLPSFEGVHRA